MVLEGVRLVQDALGRGMIPSFILVDTAAVDVDTLHSPLPQAQGSGVRASILEVSPEVIRHVSSTETPSGVVAVFPIAPPALPEVPRRVLILDEMRDPGNVGTILRSAAAAGVEVVLLSPGCADAYNPKTLRAGMGAHFRLPVLEASWTRIALYCKNLHVYLADMTGDVTYDAADWKTAWALIISSEAHGESEQAARLANQRVYIPMAAETESINAAAAASVLLFEAARQNRRQ
jgi:TrmH family RNA methyltransferase